MESNDILSLVLYRKNSDVIALKKKIEEMTEEQKAEWNAAKSEGWKKRKEKQAADKKTQRKIDSGRLPKPGEILPDWMKLADKKEK